MQKIIIKKYPSRDEIKSIICFILMGIVVFSSLSSTILIKRLHFPVSMPEILLLPFFFLAKKKLLSVKIKGSEIFLIASICGILILIGLLYGIFSLYSMLSSARSWFYLFIFTVAFSNRNLITNSDLFCVAFGSLIGWTIDSWLNYDRLMVSIIYKRFLVTYGIYLAIPLFFSYAIHYRKYMFLTVGILLMLIISIYSGIRRPLVIFILTLFFLLVLTLKDRKKNLFSFIIISAVFVVVLSTILPTLRSSMEKSSAGLFYRTFTRTEEILQSRELNSSDQGRQSKIVAFSTEFINFTIPRGMVSVRTSEDESVGIFNDFPLYQLCWIFGWPVTFILLGRFCVVFVHNYRKFNRNKDGTSLALLSSFFIIFILLFLDGTYIEYAYSTPITGIILGRAVLNAKTNSIIK